MPARMRGYFSVRPLAALGVTDLFIATGMLGVRSLWRRFTYYSEGILSYRAQRGIGCFADAQHDMGTRHDSHSEACRGTFYLTVV